MTKSFTTILICTLLAAAWLMPMNLLAADETPPELAEAWVMTVKPGHMSEFLAASKAHGEFRAEHGDTRDWQIYTATLADGLDQVAIRFCCFNWSDQDAYVQWGRDNPQVFEHWMSTSGQHVEKTEHYFDRMDWANSHWNEGEYRYYAVTTFEMKPGHEGDYDAARDKMSQIAINQGWANADRSWLWTSAIGGPSRESIVIPHKDYASMGGDNDSFTRFLTEKLGSEEAAAALLKQFGSSTAGSSLQVWEHHPELSMSHDD